MPRGAKPFFTAEQDQEIGRRYQAGETLRAIGASYGVSWRPVQAALQRLDIPRRTLSDYAWKPTDENCAEVARLFHEGLSVPKIARQVGTGNDTISKVLREEGINARYGGQNHRFKKDRIPALVKEYAETGSCAELARRHECSVTLIRNTLRRAGVEITYYGHDPRFWTDERVRWLREQHEAGRSDADIGQEIGYSQTSISTKLRDLNIRPPRPPRRGGENHAWKGGRIVDSSGYVRVRVEPNERHLVEQTISGGYVMEHRLVMARQLGRSLLDTETVHHVNGNRQDNSPENLQLRQGNHGKGVVLRCTDCGSHNVEAAPLT